MEKIKIDSLVKIIKDKKFENNQIIKSGTFGYIVDSKLNDRKQTIYLVDVVDFDEGCSLFVFNENEIELVKI